MGGYGIGLAVLGVGVLGSWLLGPKSSNKGSVPAGVPSLNQSLRGTTVPITFGTNRVSPQIVWTNNFKAVRQKSSGKGGAKGGGSGGFGSAKGGGSAAQNYLYSWDLIFNFGIVDTPSIIRRGWVGGDNLDQKTVSAITGGLSDDIINTFPISSNIVDKETASLDFQEAFFGPGFPTGSDSLDTWTFFASVTGEECAWPSNLYIGFEQLQLGQAPTVPQLTVEVVPLTTGLDIEPQILYKEDSGQSQSVDSKSQGYCEANGDLWSITYSFSAHDIRMARLRDGEIVAINNASLLADVTAAYPVVGSSRDSKGLVVCAGTPYFYVLWGTVNDYDLIEAILYKIDGDTATMVGGYEGGYAFGFGTGKKISVVHSAGKASDGTIFVFYPGSSSAQFESYISFLPNPAGLEGTYTTDPSHHLQEDRTVTMTTVLGSNIFNGGFVSRSAVNGFDKWFVYVNKSRIDYEVANHGTFGSNAHIYSLAATYPNGFMQGSDGINNFFKNADGSPFFPAVDVGKDSTGTSVTYSAKNDYSPVWKSGDYYIIFRGYTDDPNLMRVVVFDLDGNLLFQGRGSVPNTDGHAAAADTIYPYISNTGRIIIKVWYGSLSHTHYDFGSLSTVAVDLTPPYIINRMLTSETFGFATKSLFGFTPSADRIDQASYADAVALCEDQGIKISVTYNDQGDFLSIVNDLLSLYGGFLTDNDGMIQFGVVKADDAPIRTIDNKHLVVEAGKPPIQVTKAALEDGYNKVQFNYFDRSLDYKQSQVEASDEVDMDINGPRVKTFQAQYVMPGSLAQMVATRALWNNLYGNDQYSFKLGWKDADLKPGALVTLVDSFDATLRGGVLARILKWQENARGKFDVTAVQQRPYIISASADYTDTASLSSGFGGLIQPAAPPMHQTAYELPLEFQTSKANVYFGYASNMAAMGAQLYLSTDGANYVLTQDAQPFIISGALAQPLQKRHQNYVEDQVEFYIFPTSSFHVATPTFVQTYELDDISPALRAQGAGTLIVGSEAIAFEGLTLLGQNHYKARRMFRGWGGTPISAHNSGEWFHQHAAGMFNHEIGVDDIGNKFSYKIVPYNFVGKGYDISSIDAQSYQIQGLYFLPRAMSRLHVFVDSGLSVSPTTPVRDYVAVFGGQSPVTLEWADSSNHDGFGAGGYGNNLYGHYSPDAPPPQFLVSVQSNNGTQVSSFVVSTGYFNYTVLQNSADWNGFQKNLVFNVQPFNAKGVGPTSATRSLMMF